MRIDILVKSNYEFEHNHEKAVRAYLPWRSSHHAVTHVRINIVNNSVIPGRSANAVVSL